MAVPSARGWWWWWREIQAPPPKAPSDARPPRLAPAAAASSAGRSAVRGVGERQLRLRAMASLLCCGPKMAACGIVLSVWGVIMLVREPCPPCAAGSLLQRPLR
uniref:Uncharacterized protein n=1 Tax=Pseudonaja textilis TaxID=8673 RepID=A0A670ZKH4_PSETE